MLSLMEEIDIKWRATWVDIVYTYFVADACHQLAKVIGEDKCIQLMVLLM